MRTLQEIEQNIFWGIKCTNCNSLNADLYQALKRIHELEEKLLNELGVCQPQQKELKDQRQKAKLRLKNFEKRQQEFNLIFVERVNTIFTQLEQLEQEWEMVCIS